MSSLRFQPPHWCTCRTSFFLIKLIQRVRFGCLQIKLVDIGSIRVNIISVSIRNDLLNVEIDARIGPI